MKLSISSEDKILFDGFFEESLEYLDSIEEKILLLETEFSIDLVNNIFRAIHTIKGSSSFLNLASIKNLSHELEFLLDDLRRQKISISAELIELLLKGVDVLRKMILNLKDLIDNIDEGDIELDETCDLVDEIKKFRESAEIESEIKEGERIETSTVEETEEKEILKEITINDSLNNAEIENEMEQLYIEGFDEHIENIEKHLLILEQNPENVESTNEVFRSLHSLKGNSGLIVSFVGENTYEYKVAKLVQDICHDVESALITIKKGEQRFSSPLVTKLFRILDYLKFLRQAFANREQKPEINNINDIFSLIKEIEKQSKSPSEDRKASQNQKQSQSSTPYNEAIKQYCEVTEKIVNEWEKTKKIGENDINTYLRALNMLKKTLPEYLSEQYKDNFSKQEDTLNFLKGGIFDLQDGLVIDILKEKINEIKNIMGAKKESIKDKKVDEIKEQRIKKASSAPQNIKSSSELHSVKAALSSSSSTEMQSIRVKMEKLDRMMNLIGELAVSKNSFYNFYNKLVESNNLELAKEFKETIVMHVGRLADQLQDAIVQVRMVPIKTVFQKFPRMVRDIANTNNKKIKLIIQGESTELDKTVIEKINDPLVHIIRNSCDHGIEPPDERVKAGKDETGNVILRAENKGTYAVIEIIDDGRGIDPDKIKKKAIEKGLISDEQARKMTKDELINLIFLPGFSTADKVTEISGRGVGMDVVKTNINKINGTISIHSDKGIGTNITIKIPLTLAITKGLSVKIEDKIFIIPMENVNEILKVRLDSIIKYKDREIFKYRDKVIELIDLKKKYGLADNIQYANSEFNELNAVVIQNSGLKAALKVDFLEDEIDMVIKPLPEFLSNVPGIGGSTILGNGKVAIVIDPVTIFSLLQL